MKNLKNKKGFTLVELIVVIAILGILALFLVPQFTGYSQDAKNQVAQANARNVWSVANATLTQSEYDDKIVVTADGTTTTSGKKGIKDVTLEKLGDSFKSDLLTIAVDTTHKKITSVTYTTNDVACKFNGVAFSESCGGTLKESN